MRNVVFNFIESPQHPQPIVDYYAEDIEIKKSKTWDYIVLRIYDNCYKYLYSCIRDDLMKQLNYQGHGRDVYYTSDFHSKIRKIIGFSCYLFLKYYSEYHKLISSEEPRVVLYSKNEIEDDEIDFKELSEIFTRLEFTKEFRANKYNTSFEIVFNNNSKILKKMEFEIGYPARGEFMFSLRKRKK